MKQFFLFLLLSAIVTSCSETKNKNKSKQIASVNGIVLYEDVLENSIPEGLTGIDSLSFVNQFIENWTREQVVLQKAEEILSEKSKDVAQRLENYRKSLLIYSYEQAYLEDRLDTVISEKEIEAYYNDHQKEFTLKGYIIKGYFAQFSDSIDVENVKEWYQLKAEEDYVNLNSFSQLNALDYHLDTTNWIYFDKVLEEIPLEDNIHKSSFIKYKKKINFKEENINYFLNITDVKLEDELSPLVFETEKIKTIILNQRTQQLRKQLNDNLYNDALKKQQIIIYNKK